MKTLALYASKGGVGKTAAAVNLAALAAEAGIATVLWDLDPQGAASWLLEARPELPVKPKALWTGERPLSEVLQATAWPDLMLIPSGPSARHLDTWLRKDDAARTLQTLLKPLSESAALVVLDAPPSLSHLAENIFRAAQLVMVPLVPAHLSLRAMRQLLDFFAEEKLPTARIKPFWSMADRRRLLHTALIEHPPKSMPAPFKAVIPYSSAVEKMGEQRAPLVYTQPSHPAALAYRSLWEEARPLLRL